MQYLSIAIELLVGFIFLFFITRFLGKTQFSQLTPFDFISALILGELVGNAVYDNNINIIQIMFAILIWGGLIFILELVTQKFKGTRKLFEGEPNIVIHKGKLQFNTLKKIKLDINQLQSLIRQQGYFSFQEVEYAIIETNGLVSVLPKSVYDTPKNGDLNIPPKSVTLPITLIIDGEVVDDNLRETGFSQDWLKEQLTLQNILTFKDVLYAEWSKNNPLYVICYEKKSS